MKRSSLVPGRTSNQHVPKQPTGTPAGPYTRAVIQREFRPAQQHDHDDWEGPAPGTEESRFIGGVKESKIVNIPPQRKQPPPAQFRVRSPTPMTHAVMKREIEQIRHPGQPARCECACHCPYCPMHGAMRRVQAGLPVPKKTIQPTRRPIAQASSSSSDEEQPPLRKTTRGKEK